MGNAPPPDEPLLNADPINLMRGWPSKSLLPANLICNAANQALADPTTAATGLLYGPDPGYQPCRSAIAAWLTSFYLPKNPISSERICITGGASQNLGSLLSVYTDPSYTRNIWIVAPAYMLAFRVFEDAGFAGKMRAVPEDEEGIDLSYLHEELKKSKDMDKENGQEVPRYKLNRPWAKIYKHIIYCVPTFANPSSRTMSLAHRTELVKMARAHDALIISDDVYDFLQWPADLQEGQSLKTMKTAHLPRLVDIDRELDGNAGDGFGNTCSNGSFSKIVGPGVRVGWVEGTEKFAYGVSQCGTTASGGAPSQLTSTYITLLLTSGALTNHIQFILRPAYALRYRILLEAITTHLVPLGFSLPQPNRKVVGGYFVWLSLPPKMSAAELTQRCREEENVIVAPGTIFEVPGDREGRLGFDGHVRLCFAWEEEINLARGVRGMARVAGAMLEELSRGGGSAPGFGDGREMVMNEFK
ncbi:Valine--pyruvate aminotransferase [Recurvomyces mirabilis]|uniref:Valine--pyruvate aminotransferase n=1 Tax=Recurvomyces mirabilis TaxID=574656 RepID=A0AAE0TPH9_9PEZI|nr:Valine--pyruvate aminotransferase [Recurvomyces mirabilis]KAK5161002.1 Valine--pyruvate aminotransferase [Recurvomyces mirabilis]